MGELTIVPGYDNLTFPINLRDNQIRFINEKDNQEKVAYIFLNKKDFFVGLNDMKSRVILREDLYQTIIRNILKKYEFLNLSYQLATNQIDEDEFDNEIEENPDKYIIKLKEFDEAILPEIIDIIKTIGHDFTIDQVEELFALNISFNNELI